MSSTMETGSINLDQLFPPEQRRNPYPMYRLKRETQPIMHVEPMKLSVVFRYDDVQAVLADHARFSVQAGHTVLGDAPSLPRHANLRSLLVRALTPEMVADLQPRIGAIVNGLLDKALEAGQLDLIQDYAYPLPISVMAELLGIPAADCDRFRGWSDAVVATASAVPGAGDVKAEKSLAELQDYLRTMTEERRLRPKGDLISAVLRAEREGEKLTEADMLWLCRLLLVAGNQTTTNLIGNAVLALLEHPDQFARLRAKPSLIISTVEEGLRFYSPVQFMFRRAAEDVRLGDETIPAGHTVLAAIGSANRDESKFPDGEKFDIARNPNPHLAFGEGIYACPGASLARLEGRVALDAVLWRLPGLRRLNDRPLEPAHGSVLYGVKSLPVTFAV